MKCDAEFGPEGLQSAYRYKLGRDWSGEQQQSLLPAFTAPDCARCGCLKESHIPRDCTAMKSCCLSCGDCPDYVAPFKYALFIMLNPSTADHQNDDPTVAKCIRLARRWGFQGLQVRNIFAIRGSDPAIIKRVDEPTGGVRNDTAIISAAVDPRCGVIVAAWGNHGVYNGRSLAVRNLLQETGRPVCCFGISGQSEPVHPLYQTERDLGEMEIWL
jgi:hypothetical protein